MKSRALLRVLLGRQLGVPAQAVELVTGPFGKPQLANASGVHFNISHSAGMALVAISSEEVGVDIERMVLPADYRAVAETVFGPSEIETLSRADAAAAADVFFKLWTRKEAYLKATGQGFSSDLGAISTAAGPRVLDTSGDAGERAWYVQDLRAPEGFKAALASPVETPDVTYRDLNTADSLETTCPELVDAGLAAA